MKKFTVISLVALLILAFGATAYAQAKLDFRASGSIDAQTHYSVNVPPLNPAGNPIYGVGGAAAGYANYGSALDRKVSYWDSRFSLRFDAVIIAGQAKSHCVAWTIDDLLTDILRRDRSLVEKVYLLEDCTSPVVVPGVIDYTDEADEAFRRFVQAGMQVVRSTDPLKSWPGIRL